VINWFKQPTLRFDKFMLLGGAILFLLFSVYVSVDAFPDLIDLKFNIFNVSESLRGNLQFLAIFSMILVLMAVILRMEERLTNLIKKKK